MSSSQNGVLDQILLEDIARHCPQQFLAFHQCMSKPEPDAKNCAVEQYHLAGCIKTGVPAFQKIQGVCAGKLQAYEGCLRSNNNDTRRCQTDLKQLRECASGTIS